MSPEGAVEDPYRLLELIGEGGAGRVHRAVHRLTGEVVALKLLREHEPRGLERFAREARILAEIGHPHVVRYVAHGVAASGEPYLAMEWLEGESLAARLERGALGIEESVALGSLLAGALAAAHACGVIHRDIKPSNIFLVDGALTDPRVLDFGTAYASEAAEALTRTGTTLGTPGYMAPEQARGDRARVDARADVFSLGAVLFQCLTGRRAFPGEHVMAVLAQLLLADAPRVRDLRPEVSEALDALVARLLAKDPATRPADGEAVMRALSALGPLDSGEAAPWSAGRGPAITGDQQRLLAVVAVTFGPLVGEAQLARARSVAALLGARIEEAAGALLATLTGPESATDLAARAARCALRLGTALPEAAVSMGMGHAEGRGEVALAADLAAAKLAPPTPRPGGVVVRIDDVTRALLDERFVVHADAAGGWALTRENEIGETARTLLGRPSPYVGRERELRMLSELIAQTFEGDRGAQAVVVTAPAGMGKTRLRHELIRSLRATKPTLAIAVGRADAMSAGSTFVVITSLLRTSLTISAGEPAASARVKVSGWLARVVPEGEHRRVTAYIGEMMGIPFPDDDDEGLRAARQSAARMSAEMVRAFVDGLRGVCAVSPMLLVLEDLHWGDDASIQLIDQALRDLEDQPLVVLALARPEVNDLFPDLWSKRGVQNIRLGALPRRAAEELVTRTLEAPIPPADLARLCDQAGGNAFYLEELIRAYAAGGHDRLPETVLGMVEARLEAVPVAPRRLLRAASVFGEVFPAAGALALLGEGDRDDAGRRWLPWLIDREILVRRPGTGDDEEHAFRHALLREGSYAMLTERDRVLGHQLAAAWLIGLAEGPGGGGSAGSREDETRAAVIGEHLWRGEQWGAAFTWYDRAGDAAHRLHASVEARLHYQRALGALSRDGDGDEVRRRRVDTMIKKAEVSYGDDPGPNLVMLEGAHAIAATLPEAARPPSDDYRRVALVDYWMGRSHWYLNAYGDALSCYRRVVVAAEALGDPDLAALPSGTIGRVLISQGHFGRCLPFLAATLGPLELRRSWTDWILNSGNVGLSLAARGHTAEGVARGELGLARAAELGSPTSLSIAHTQLATILLVAGELTRGRELARVAADIAEQAGDRAYAFLGHSLSVWADSGLGDHQASLDGVRRARQIMTDLGRRLFFADWLDAFAVESLARAGRPAEAIAAAEEAMPGFQANGSTFAEAIAHRGWGTALAEGGDLEGAAAHLGESLRLLTAGECAMEAARTRILLARGERRRGDGAAAALLLAAAAQVLGAAEMEAAVGGRDR